MELERFLRAICEIWQRQAKLCEEAKERDFGATAKKLWSFLGKSYRQLYMVGEEDLSFGNRRNPYYKTRVSKSAEAVALLVPWVLSQIPHRLVTPSRPPLPDEIARVIPQAALLRQAIDPDDQLGAYLAQWFLNYIPLEYGLKREARTTLPEAFVKGRGVLWHEMVEAPAGLIPSSQFESVDNLLIDSDSIKLKDAGFVMRYRERSVWKVAAESGLSRDYLRSIAKSNFQRAVDGKETTNKQDQDVCGYWEIYSRVGMGHWLDRGDKQMDRLADVLDELGPHVYLEVMPGVEFPLNLNPATVNLAGSIDELKQAIAWPVPFWADMAGNPWPCSVLDFYPHQSDPWADSPLQPGLPMQIYLDHLYSFAMSRIRITSRNIALVAAKLEEAAKEALKSGDDLITIAVSGEPGIDFAKLFHMVEFPKTNEDLWTIGSMVERAYERATGLDPLLYGAESARQVRSAKEAGIREAHASSRPDDYADAVEDWMSAAAGKELQMARLLVDETVVAPLFGESLPDENDPEGVLGPMTDAWARLFRTDNPYLAAAEYCCTVESGSARRKNKQKQVQDMELTVQTLGQPFLALAMQGISGPFNAMVQMLGDAQGFDTSKMLLPEGLQMQPQEDQEGEEAG